MQHNYGRKKDIHCIVKYNTEKLRKMFMTYDMIKHDYITINVECNKLTNKLQYIQQHLSTCNRL